MSVSSTEHLDKLAFILYDRPSGRNIIGYAIEKIEQLRAELSRATSNHDNASLEVERLRKALQDIAEDCEDDYPPSPGAIKYAVQDALRGKP